jgi:hypothetical protein
MIYAIGCSFTQGAKLPGQVNMRRPVPGAWPDVLSQLINQEIINQGRSASGNTRMVKRAIDAVLEKADGVIICWTNPERTEFSDDVGIYDVWPGRHHEWVPNNDQTRHRSELIKYITLHQSGYNSQLHSYKNWLRQVILVQNLCKSNNMPLIMLIAFGAAEYTEAFGDDPGVKQLMTLIDKASFLDHTLATSTDDWTYGTSRTSKMPIRHPDLEGHRIIANKIYEHIRNSGWLS